LREKKLENRNNLLLLLLILCDDPFTHPRKDPLEAVVQWDLNVKESRTPQPFSNKKSRFKAGQRNTKVAAIAAFLDGYW